MHKIFHYELRRLLWNKFFFGLLAVTLFYAYQVFTGEIILGVAHTAPFSPWSFGCYLSRLLPPMLLALGSGWLLGRVQGALVYVWMLLPFVLNLLPLPQALGLWNGSLFSEYPLCLAGLDPAFTLPAAVWAAQAAFLLLGILFLGICTGKNR